MIILVIILVLLLLLVIKDYAQGFKLWFSAFMDNDGVYIDIKYLHSLVKIIVTIRENVPTLMVFLFGAKLFKARLIKEASSKKTFNARRLLKAANIKHLMISTSYGFQDPFTTGLVYGALSSAAPFFPIEEMTQSPDFMSSELYFNMDANANLNLGQTIANYIKNK